MKYLQYINTIDRDKFFALIKTRPHILREILIHIYDHFDLFNKADVIVFLGVMTELQDETINEIITHIYESNQDKMNGAHKDYLLSKIR